MQPFLIRMECKPHYLPCLWQRLEGDSRDGYILNSCAPCFGPTSQAPRKRSVIPCPTVSIPTITVNSGHLVNISHCPICLGQFQIGTQAREMPCNHIYHSDCIIPWLANNITCPVCRHAFPSEQTNSPSAPSRQHVYMHLYIAFLILLQGFWIILIG